MTTIIGWPRLATRSFIDMLHVCTKFYSPCNELPVNPFLISNTAFSLALLSLLLGIWIFICLDGINVGFLFDSIFNVGFYLIFEEFLLSNPSAVGGIWGLLALKLADCKILPFNYVTYADSLQACFKFQLQILTKDLE